MIKKKDIKLTDEDISLLINAKKKESIERKAKQFNNCEDKKDVTRLVESQHGTILDNMKDHL